MNARLVYRQTTALRRVPRAHGPSIYNDRVGLGVAGPSCLRLRSGGTARSMSSPSAPRPSDATAAAASSSTQTPDNASGKTKDSVLDGEDVPKELPILPRPLGVPNHPSTKHASWTETMWDQETRMENRRVL